MMRETFRYYYCCYCSCLRTSWRAALVLHLLLLGSVDVGVFVAVGVEGVVGVFVGAGATVVGARLAGVAGETVALPAATLEPLRPTQLTVQQVSSEP